VGTVWGVVFIPHDISSSEELSFPPPYQSLFNFFVLHPQPPCNSSSLPLPSSLLPRCWLLPLSSRDVKTQVRISPSSYRISLKHILDLGDLITSAVADGVTSAFGEATSAIADAGDAVTSKGAEIGDSITSKGAEVGDAVTSRGAQVGSAINSLATKATSAIGAEITEADDDGAALSSFRAQQALLVGAATVLGSAFFGAVVAL
jgi:hypothetical protein